MAADGWPKRELCFLPMRFRWTLLLMDDYGNCLSGCGSNTLPSNWGAVCLPLSCCLPPFSLIAGWYWKQFLWRFFNR